MLYLSAEIGIGGIFVFVLGLLYNLVSIIGLIGRR